MPDDGKTFARHLAEVEAKCAAIRAGADAIDGGGHGSEAFIACGLGDEGNPVLQFTHHGVASSLGIARDNALKHI